MEDVTGDATVDVAGDVQSANSSLNAATPGEHARRIQQPRGTVAASSIYGEEEGTVRDMNSNSAGTQSSSQPGNIFHSGPHLAHYATTAALGQRSPQVTNINFGSRTSMEATGLVQPSLPSPAPSDENTQSPTFPEHQIKALRNRGGQRMALDMSYTGLTAMSRPGSPLVMQSPLQAQQAQQAQTQQQQQQRQHWQVSGMPLNSMAVQANGLSPQMQFLPQPQQYLPNLQSQHPTQLQHQQQHRNTQSNIQRTQFHGPVQQSNVQPVQTPPMLPSNHGHPQGQSREPRHRPVASRIPKHILLKRIHDVEQAMQPHLQDVDHGRLTLLRYAVEKEDWFYQVLSQVFCLRTVMPSLLPKSLKDVPDISWDQLGSLLCQNTAVNNELLTFFSEFPEPIMDLYSDPHNAREVYEARVQSIKVFLMKLPQHWDGLAQRCRELEAPPLVEDMETILHLHSVVLQNTCFRAIARLFWGVTESDGIKALESLHELDQHNCVHNRWRRTAQEKQQAYGALNLVYRLWKTHEQRQEENRLGIASQPIAPFAVSQDVYTLFRTMPRSMMPPVPQQMLHSQMLPQQTLNQWQPQSPGHQLQQQQRYLQAAGRPQNIGRIPSSPDAQAFSSPHMQQLQPPVPPGRTPTLASPHTTPHSAALRTQPTAMRRLVFPTQAEIPRAQLTHPEPSRCGLHQAHLRSPNLVLAEPKQDAPRLYRFVTGYAMAPATIKKRTPVQLAHFEISDDSFDKIAKTIPAPADSGKPNTRVISEDSLMYRLRCCAVPATGFTDESSWVVADSVWPESLSFELNGVQLYTRRKLHHGRYLPIDVTAYVNRGINKLKVFLNRPLSDKRRFDFALAVETIGVTSHNIIKDGLGRVSAQDSLATIKKALSEGGTVDNEDEIAVTSSNMTISVVEPLSQARLVDVPVRGANCLHKDAFDLEVFLSVCKRIKPEWPTIVDCWRCPLCRGDVRPQTLIVDEFLVHVRDELQKMGLTDTKAIVVESNGSWKPKKDERTGVRSASLEREEAGRSASAAAPSAPVKAVEIIEID